MNVKELIDQLRTMPEDLDVVVEDMEWERHPLQTVLDETMVGVVEGVPQEVCLLVTSRSEELVGT